MVVAVVLAVVVILGSGISFTPHPLTLALGDTPTLDYTCWLCHKPKTVAPKG